MPPHASTSPPSVSFTDFRFHCIECGHLEDNAGRDFRCASCGDLVEITYPRWKEALPSAESLKSAWSARRISSDAVDQSGVWRFRDLLPAVENHGQVITLREGNTPLYELPRCARIT